MIQEQKFVTSTGFRRDTRQRAASSLFLSSLLVGIAITLVLTLIEVVIFWLVNPLHVPGSSIASSLSALLALVIQSPSLLLIPLGELIVITFAVLLAAKPLALFAYLRAVHSVQEKYHRLYTPLKALTSVRQTLEDSPEDIITPSAIVAEEQISILDFLQQQDTHQFILGVSGAGKTVALCTYQYITTQQSLALSSSRGRIPVYVPMKNYNLFLKQREQISAEDAQQVTLLDFLYESDLPDIRHLRRYLPGLSREGRLLLLCDGLNEVDSDYLARVSEELLWWMRDTRNQLVVTCREVDYREQQGFAQLVDEGRAARAVISPLQSGQINELVERYVERQDKHWQHTAGQIMQVIDRSRLRYHCTNPLMLFTLMEIIDKIGVERGKRSDTRGRLLREYVKQLIEHEQRQGKWNRGGSAEQDVLRFLSEVACAAHWANDSNAIQLKVSVPVLASERGRGKANFDELADALQAWLDEHPAKGPFVEAKDAEALPGTYHDLPRLLQCALSAALIEISPSG
ncbi:MAG: NACHT domain-containing protein, partial [Chloroflexi bacterium]|nr:NACHT domain-containing protein [Chloroflexota bacterium]